MKTPLLKQGEGWTKRLLTVPSNPAHSVVHRLYAHPVRRRKAPRPPADSWKQPRNRRPRLSPGRGLQPRRHLLERQRGEARATPEVPAERRGGRPDAGGGGANAARCAAGPCAHEQSPGGGCEGWGGASAAAAVRWRRILRGRGRATSRIPTLGFRRANFGLFKDLLGGIPWVRALEGQGVQHSWSLVKGHFLHARDGCVPRRKKSSKGARRPPRMSKELLEELKWKQEGDSMWKKGLDTWEQRSSVVMVCRDATRKARHVKNNENRSLHLPERRLW